MLVFEIVDLVHTVFICHAVPMGLILLGAFAKISPAPLLILTLVGTAVTELARGGTAEPGHICHTLGDGGVEIDDGHHVVRLGVLQLFLLLK